MTPDQLKHAAALGWDLDTSPETETSNRMWFRNVRTMEVRDEEHVEWLLTEPMNTTKFIYEPGCDLATGWDGAHLDGKHSSGHEMRVTVTRSMFDPRHVRYSSTIDGSQHLSGNIEGVERDELEKHLPEIWEHAFKAKSEHREPIA